MFKNVVEHCMEHFDQHREVMITDMLHNSIEGISSDIKSRLVKDGKEMTQDEWRNHVSKLRRTCGEFV